MISKKELGYVDLWASKTPYPGRKYAEQVMNILKASFELYKSKYLNKKYSILFSNQEEIEFEVMSKNVAHMLGIDYKNLSGDYFLNYRQEILGDYSFKAFELVEAILENRDKVLEADENLEYRALNYYRILIKCEIFSKLSDLTSFKYGCINFDKEVYNRNSDIQFGARSTKLLYTESDESISPLFFMGLKEDEELYSRDDLGEITYIKRPNYIVETLIAPTDISRFFIGQEVVIPTQILTDSDGKLVKSFATPSEKIRLLKEYKAIINEYGIKDSHINIYGDYMSSLMEQQVKDDNRIK